MFCPNCNKKLRVSDTVTIENITYRKFVCNECENTYYSSERIIDDVSRKMVVKAIVAERYKLYR